MSDRDDEFADDADLGDDNSNPLADLSPFAQGDEGTNLDDDSAWELEDSEYQDDVSARIRALAARHGVGRTSRQRWRTGRERGHVATATEQPAPAAAQLSLL